MRRWLMIDEFRVSVEVPVTDMTADRAVRRALAGNKFIARLRPMVRQLAAATPGLMRARIRVSR